MPLRTLQATLGVSGVDAFFESVAGEVHGALPSDAFVTFELLGEGGGTWTLHAKPEGIDVRPGRAVWADSVLRCSMSRFVDLVTGAVDVREAFFDGTVRVEGDVGLLVRLHQALPQAA